MDKASDDREFKSHMTELESLLQQVERIKDAPTRELTGGIIQSLMEFHGAAVSRMLEHLGRVGEAGQAALNNMAQDELVSSLLLLYGLHPLDIEARVRLALDSVRPYLASHGGNVELLEVTPEAVVRLRMQGSCHGCPSSAVTLKNSIEQAIYDKAPDVAGIQVEDVHEPHAPAAQPPGFVPVESLLGGAGKRQLQGAHS
ncbi:MAG TPA: NifU family protein [Tepidisphaeraceae bacterium]|nr:NifU family protein [Tepidisphaeraceae bacterium]